MERMIAALTNLDDNSRAILARQGVPVSAPAGTRVFEPGKQCEYFYLLARGMIRVQIVGESGREIVLYRVGPGDACVMTVSCLMGQGLYNGEGIVETALEGIAVNYRTFNELLECSARFRTGIFTAYSARFLELVDVLENVAFRSLDMRLAGRLLQGEDAEGWVHGTHQLIATDLGSSREVVSRQLKRWEEDGLIHIERGAIRLLRREQLAALFASGRP